MKVENRLGKGLSAFFENKNQAVPVFNNTTQEIVDTSVNEVKENLEKNGILYIPVGNIVANPNQPRKEFKEEQLRELALSIEKNGVLQPILVRKTSTPNQFEIIAGERRWRAANLAGIYEIPAILKDLSDKETFEIGLIENLQRENLSPIEEGNGYKKLMIDFGYTQEDIAKLINKSRSYVANILRLLALPKDVQEMISDGRLSYTVARTLIGEENPSKKAKSLIKGDINARDAEKMKENIPVNHKSSDELNPELISLKDNLMEHLGVNVDIKCKNNKGEVIIKFKDLGELDTLMTKLNNI
ncbi:MAG: ParB/RepB/Spo0J family partition protein [Alphaproteobacteria bacterium]